MADKRVSLAVAAFLDGPRGRALGLSVDAARRLTTLLVSAAYEHAGVEPRGLDGEQVRELLLEAVPRRLGRGDPDSAHVPAVARAFFSHLSETEMVPHAFEIDLALVDLDAEFPAAVARVGPDERVGGTTATIRNRAAPLGRNDPCPCGSGKKWKKCCARKG